MIKIIVLLVLFSLISYIGFSIAMFYKKKESFYAEFMSFTESFFNNVKFNKTKILLFVEDYVLQCKTDCKQLLTEYYIHKNKNVKLSVLSKTENNKIISFLDSIGNLDVAGELQNIENFKLVLSNEFEKSKSDVKQYGTLYSKLGVLVGLVVVIVLL